MQHIMFYDIKQVYYYYYLHVSIMFSFPYLTDSLVDTEMHLLCLKIHAVVMKCLINIHAATHSFHISVTSATMINCTLHPDGELVFSYTEFGTKSVQIHKVKIVVPTGFFVILLRNSDF
jgi:hypothetical protein